MATYTCDTGYNISRATQITCMSDDGTSNGTWSPSPPTVTCAREYCTDFIAMYHNGSAKYKIYNTCNDDTMMWSSTVRPTCERKSNYYQYFSDDFMSYITKCYFYSVICRNVGVPTNGVVTYSDLTIPRAVDSTVTYSCVFGYEFSGGVPRICTASGWSNGGSPTCRG